MAVYMVERSQPGIKMDQLAAAQKAAIATSQDMTREGKNVRYIRSTFVPGDARCMCLFEASSEKDVEEVNRKANIPFTKITEAMDLTPQS
jgi:muconolactone delta-isomerase